MFLACTCVKPIRILFKHVIFYINVLMSEFGQFCIYPMWSSSSPSTNFQSFQRFQWVALHPFATILSFIRIIRAVAHFYGNFFVHFFCLELFRVNFFRARSRQLQHAVRYVTPHVPILSTFFPPFLYGFYSIRSPVHVKKRIFIFHVSFMSYLWIMFRTKKSTICFILDYSGR